MKKLIIAFTAVSLGLLVVANPPHKNNKSSGTTMKVDATASTFKWTAKKVSGEHWGDVKFQSGEIIINGKQLTGGKFVMDMTTLDSKDMSGEWKDKLVGHLKSEDFFSVDKFQTAELVIKSVEAIKGAAPGANNYNIKADLTIKGITKEVSFPAMVVISKGEVVANAEFSIDRTLYDIRYRSLKFFSDIGDKAIEDTFSVKVRVVAKG